MSLLSRLKGLLQIQRLEQDLDDELLSQVEMRAEEENLAAEMSPAEARYDAQRRFGNSTLLQEQIAVYEHRALADDSRASGRRHGPRVGRFGLPDYGTLDPHRCIRHVSLHDGGHGVVPQPLGGECGDGGHTGAPLSEKFGIISGLLMLAYSGPGKWRLAKPTGDTEMAEDCLQDGRKR